MDYISWEVIFVDILIYWVLSLAVVALGSLYGSKKLGKASEGYKALAMPRFLSLGLASAAAIIILFVTMKVNVSSSVSTFFGVPFFAVWTFFLCCLFRRIRAERYGGDR